MNMNIEDDSSNDVTSGTLTFELIPCDPPTVLESASATDAKGTEVTAAPSRRKRSTRMKPASFEVTLPMTQEFPLITVNATPTAYDMMYHSFPVAVDPVSVTINLYPNDTNVTYGVYLKHESQPNKDNYDFMFVLPSNESLSINTTMSEEDMFDLDRTIFLSKDNLTNGTYQVGIAFHGK